MIKSLWTFYYEKAVSKQSSPKTHGHHFSCEEFKFVRKFFDEVVKINLGMEIYVVRRRR
jgi:hypothetical protein